MRLGLAPNSEYHLSRLGLAMNWPVISAGQQTPAAARSQSGLIHLEAALLFNIPGGPGDPGPGHL
jgi:hypothetical protein